MAKRKDIDKICARAMVIVTISCFAKKTARKCIYETRRRLIFTPIQGLHGGRGRCVHSPAVGGAMAVSIVAVTDISRNFCEQFFAIVGPWLDYGIPFSFF